MHKGKLRNMTSLYLIREDGILCLYRIGSRVADHMYVGSAGGHFEPEEVNDARKCVLREAREELELGESELLDLKMRYVTLRYKNGELRQNYYFFARLKEDRPLRSNEGQLSWFSWKEAESLSMPVSARHMLDHYLKVGRFDDHVYAGITEPCGSRFVILEEFGN